MCSPLDALADPEIAVAFDLADQMGERATFRVTEVEHVIEDRWGRDPAQTGGVRDRRRAGARDGWLT